MMQPKLTLTPTIPVKPFDLDAALAGAPFIHRFDAVRSDARTRISTTIVKIDHPEHPAIAVYRGEWLVYNLEHGELDDMATDLFLVDNQ